jgi:hypothetical protein
MTHLANRPLNSSIDSVNVPGVATDANLVVLQQLLEIQQQQLHMLKNIYLSLVNAFNQDVDIDFFDEEE